MKAKLLSKLKVIEVKDALEDTRENLSREDEFILKQYDALFNALKLRFADYSSTNLYALNNNILYIKVINQFEIDSYFDPKTSHKAFNAAARKNKKLVFLRNVISLQFK